MFNARTEQLWCVYASRFVKACIVMITANDAFDEWNYRIALLCTLCLKKVSTIKLSVTLSNVN